MISKSFKTNNINIIPFMINDLKLRGNTLKLYALLNSLYRRYKHVDLSIKGLATWCGCSTATIKRCLNRLEYLGLIQRINQTKAHNMKDRNDYVVLSERDLLENEPSQNEPSLNKTINRTERIKKILIKVSQFSENKRYLLSEEEIKEVIKIAKVRWICEN